MCESAESHTYHQMIDLMVCTPDQLSPDEFTEICRAMQAHVGDRTMDEQAMAQLTPEEGRVYQTKVYTSALAAAMDTLSKTLPSEQARKQLSHQQVSRGAVSTMRCLLLPTNTQAQARSSGLVSQLFPLTHPPPPPLPLPLSPQLLAEVLSQLAFFKPNPKVIKRRIEALIDREYLERDPDVPNTYKYLA